MGKYQTEEDAVFITCNSILQRFLKALVLILILNVAFVSVYSAYAQQTITVSGKVVDSSDSPLPGVTVYLKGATNIGAVTDSEGDYSLVGVPVDGVLVYSFVGMRMQEINVVSRTTINVMLKQEAIGLEEVVAIGYGTTTKKEITGSVASVKREDFNRGDQVNPITLLQGKVAGLNIVQGEGGDPNANPEILLRGTTTLAGGTGPLVIVDGVPGVSLSSIDPNSIASIDVLKDGSAAAIYGTRGTNGVIIVTTQRPSVGRTKIELSSSISVQAVAKKLENLSADQFRETLQLKYPGSESSYDFGANTDWFDEITRTPFNHNTTLSLTGGTNTLGYRAMISYRENTGLELGNSLERTNTSILINQKEFNNRLSVDYSFNYTIEEKGYSDTWAMQQAFRYNPTAPVYDENNLVSGGYYMNSGPFEYYNPVAMLKESTNDGDNTYANGSINADMEIVKGVKVGGRYGIINQQYTNSYYRTRYYPIAIGTNGEAYKESGTFRQDLGELRAELSRQINKHNIQAFVGYSYQKEVRSNFWSRNKDFDTDLYSYNNLGAGYALATGNASMDSYKSQNQLIAYYGRVMYNYDSKYLLSGSVRREGSSRFGHDEKWGIFPAISVGWVISEENFMQELNFVNFLKLRVGYGITGNQEISNYQSLELLSTQGKMYYAGRWINTYGPASNPNPNLKWEQKAEIDVGFDFSILDSKFTGTLDFYNRKTSDLLWWYNVPVPPNLYGQTFDNVGEITNWGIEFMTNYKVIESSDFSWNTSANFSLNRNKVNSLSDESRGYELTRIDAGYIGTDIKTYTVRIEVDKPLGNFVGPVWEGYDPATGQSIYKDIDGSEDINLELDREVIGNAYPKFMLGWNNQFTYKNFDLSFFLRGAFGHDILNWHRMYYDNFQYFGSKNILAMALKYPDFSGAAEYSSRYVENGTYVKLDNITLGYTLKKDNPVFESMRIYVTGQQLLTFTSYKGVDPEISLSGLAPGVDNYSYYPRIKTYSLGVNITF